MSDDTQDKMDPAGSVFMEMTKYPNLEESDQSKGIPQPDLVLGEMGNVRISLPPIDEMNIREYDLTKAIGDRTSHRTYDEQPLTLAEFSYLLWATQGIKSVNPGRATKRTVPSAGARHAFETLILVNRVEDLDSGLYRYMPLEHELIPVPVDASIAEDIQEACLGQKMITGGAVTFFWVAVRYRMTWRYGERGYRYLHLDAGHVCQNLSLAAEAIDSGTCAIAAFDDDQLNQVLDLDGQELFVIYLASVGKKKDQ